MSTSPETWTFELPPRNIPGGVLIGPRSHLVDRFRAECTEIRLPPRAAETGSFTVEAGPMTANATQGRLPSLLGKKTKGDDWFFDMRHHEPENFAHFLNNHLPAFFKSADVAGRDWADAQLLLPAKTPGYILDIAALFGLRTLTTRKSVRGAGVSFTATPWTAIRSERAVWAGSPDVQNALARAMDAAEGPDLPRKVFVSRKTTRKIENSGEIETWLHNRGFETVFPEDLTILDQMRLFREADEIVAIHGAALAPLLYCTPDARPRRLVEILPVGHMTDVYREMAHLVDCAWIGVQGRMKPAHLKGLYDLDTPFTAHSLDDFEVDPASLELAFDLLSRT